MEYLITEEILKKMLFEATKWDTYSSSCIEYSMNMDEVFNHIIKKYL